jgi:5,10-methylene-tetrahydrofolate dehydrogenase/methenyl tetrahydrofolate cyclohydrolase
MSATLMDGTGLAKRIKAGLKEEAAAFAAAQGVPPALAVLRIGDDEAAAG